ncbi:MAG: pilus assembly protein, partial [Desulfovibrionaceae bacterium]|nr:pilus assembly protein [Desulfovibrionaceae bacterium]
MLALCACSPKIDPHGKLQSLEEDFQSLGKEHPYRLVKDSPYLAIQRVALDDKAVPILTSKITLRSQGSLQEICDNIMELLPIQVNLVTENDLKAPVSSSASPPIAQLLPKAPMQQLPGDYPPKLHINHSGPLRNLLDQIAAQSGYGWDYEVGKNTVTFARTLVKTFVLQTAPGRVSFNTQLSNKSRETQGGSSLGNNVRATQNTHTTSSQSSQQYQGDLGFDVFKDTLNCVRSMLSPIGRAEGNQAAGTLTVRDRPENLRQIANYINEVNSRYAKQVAMKVNVYSLEINDTGDLGLDVAALLPKLNLGPSHVSLAAGALQASQGLGTATAAILDGHFKGSQSMLTALKKVGKAKQITSAGIVALNNQPAPVEAIKRIAYLAGTSVETTDSGSETELTPGEVTTGFSMTITPHILSDRRVVLQYNVQLATLDALESFETNNTTIQLPQVSSR